MTIYLRVKGELLQENEFIHLLVTVDYKVSTSLITGEDN